MSSSDRALVNAFKEISNMADRINLPRSIVDRANDLFKKVHDGKNLKGRSNDAIASACLYIACRFLYFLLEYFSTFSFISFFLIGKKVYHELSKKFVLSVRSAKRKLVDVSN